MSEMLLKRRNLAKPDADNLTVRQLAIVRAIRGFIAEHRYSPSIREVGKAVGLISPSSTAYQLDQLQEAGVIRWQRDVPRSIVLVAGDCAHCGGTGNVGGAL